MDNCLACGGTIIDGICTKCRLNTRGKDPIAVALGQRGGRKGGAARAEALSPERRKEIAKQGADARWSNRFKRLRGPRKDQDKQV